MREADLEALVQAGARVEQTPEALRIFVLDPRKVHPLTLMMEGSWLLVSLVLGALVVLTYALGGPNLLAMEWMLGALVVLGLLCLPVIHRMSRKKARVMAEMTLTDHDLVLPEQRIPLRDIEDVTFTEQMSCTRLAENGVQVSTADETVTIPMPIMPDGRAPLVRIVRQYVERSRT